MNACTAHSFKQMEPNYCYCCCLLLCHLHAHNLHKNPFRSTISCVKTNFPLHKIYPRNIMWRWWRQCNNGSMREMKEKKTHTHWIRLSQHWQQRRLSRNTIILLSWIFIQSFIYCHFGTMSKHILFDALEIIYIYIRFFLWVSGLRGENSHTHMLNTRCKFIQMNETHCALSSSTIFSKLIPIWNRFSV